MKPEEQSKVQGQKSQVEGRRLKVEERMLRMFTSEQIVQMLEVLELTYDQAVIRKCDQKFYILFNEKGLPVRFGGTNDVKPIRPMMYKAE